MTCLHEFAYPAHIFKVKFSWVVWQNGERVDMGESSHYLVARTSFEVEEVIQGWEANRNRDERRKIFPLFNPSERVQVYEVLNVDIQPFDPVFALEMLPIET